MKAELAITEAVNAEMIEGHAARIARDAARIKELAYTGFEGPAYEVFEIELYLEAQPILLGMLRKGTLAQIAQKQCSRLGRKFFVHEDDMRLLRSSSDARDQIMVDVLTEAMRKLRLDLKAGSGWKADHNGPRGASCLMTYFIHLCVWTFRRGYVRWATERVEWARLHTMHDFTDDAANGGISGLVQAPGYLSEPEAIVFSTNFEDILDEQQPETQAVVRLTVAGFSGPEIADRLNTSHGAVRNRLTRFRTALYEAARERRIWIPEQLHTNPSASRQQNRRGEA
ncbi:RNA polymerase sigma factor [Streptomyces aureoverticillatus]|uniref:RNA polymerase sigma factor n=1 Tax=Streptomyces aureoverticillatus TaxID=66871 RepID=UPI0013DBB6C5|nr:hypothetical protein [Streptomyces aureoverticillatus]QIB49565.1 hypothetical protein G3H79_41105 [Streptomyces aureoverticillatus]